MKNNEVGGMVEANTAESKLAQVRGVLLSR
jgi:hypothetical protein